MVKKIVLVDVDGVALEWGRWPTGGIHFRCITEERESEEIYSGGLGEISSCMYKICLCLFRFVRVGILMCDGACWSRGVC